MDMMAPQPWVENLTESKPICAERASHPPCIHCVAHVLNLTLVHASELSAIRNILGTVGEDADYFNSSNLRCQSLTQAMAEFEETRKEKIKIPCAFRWVEKQDAVHTFFAVYPVVCDQLLTRKSCWWLPQYLPLCPSLQQLLKGLFQF